jgi:hypothetical protein
MAQTSRPERTRSLANLELKPCHKYFGVASSFDLAWIRRFEEELNGFLQLGASGLDALACDVELGTKSNASVALVFNDRRKLLCPFY